MQTGISEKSDLFTLVNRMSEGGVRRSGVSSALQTASSSGSGGTPFFRIYTLYVPITNMQLLPPWSSHLAVTLTLFQLIKQETKIQGTFKGRDLIKAVFMVTRLLVKDNTIMPHPAQRRPSY